MANSVLMLKSLHKMQINGQFCDIELCLSNGDVVLAHSCVLVSVSKTFERLINENILCPNSNLKRIEIPREISTSSLKYLINKIYSGEALVLSEYLSTTETDTEDPVLDRDEIDSAVNLLGAKIVINKKLLKSSFKHKKNSALTKQSKTRNKIRKIKMLKRHFPNNDTKPSKIKCKICGKLYRTDQLLKLHVKYLHGLSDDELKTSINGSENEENNENDFQNIEHLNSESPENKNKNLKQRISCLTCNKSFSNVYVMKLHSRTHTGNEQYSCKICFKKFPYKGSLTNHYRSHDEIKKFVCSICGKSFSQKIHAKEHESQHTGLKRYQCPEPDCLKLFSQKSGLARHKQTIHEKIKPYICETCGQTFTRKTKLNEHNRCHTGEKPYVCNICTAAFKSNRSLKNHKQKNHQVIVPNNQIGITPKTNFYSPQELNTIPNTLPSIPTQINQSTPVPRMIEPTSMDTLAAVAEQEMSAQVQPVLVEDIHKRYHNPLPIHIQDPRTLNQEIIISNFNNGQISTPNTTVQHLPPSFNFNSVPIITQRIVQSGLLHPQKLINGIPTTSVRTQLPTLILPQQTNNTIETRQSVEMWNSDPQQNNVYHS